jgi:hypothetical protein
MVNDFHMHSHLLHVVVAPMRGVGRGLATLEDGLPVCSSVPRLLEVSVVFACVLFVLPSPVRGRTD